MKKATEAELRETLTYYIPLPIHLSHDVQVMTLMLLMPTFGSTLTGLFYDLCTLLRVIYSYAHKHTWLI